VKTLTPEALERLQFGGLINAIGNVNEDVARQALKAAGAVAGSKPVQTAMIPFEAEEKYVGRPLASLLTPAVAPFLSPEQEERFKQVAAMLLVPSTAILSGTGVGLGVKGARMALKASRAARAARGAPSAALAMRGVGQAASTAKVGARSAAGVAQGTASRLEQDRWLADIRRTLESFEPRETAASRQAWQGADEDELVQIMRSEGASADEIREGLERHRREFGEQPHLARAPDQVIRRVFQADRERWLAAGEEMMIQSDAVDDYGGDRTLAALDLIESFDTAEEATQWVRTQAPQAGAATTDALRAVGTERRVLGRQQLLQGESHAAGVTLNDVRQVLEGPPYYNPGGLSGADVRQALASGNGDQLMQRAMEIADLRRQGESARRTAAATKMPTFDPPTLPDEFTKTDEVYMSANNQAVYIEPKRAKGSMSLHRSSSQPDIWEATISGKGRGASASEFSGLGVAQEWLKLAKPLKRWRELNPQATIVAAPVADVGPMGAPRTMAKYGKIDSIDKALVALRDPELMVYVPEYDKAVNPEWRSILYQAAGFEDTGGGHGSSLILPNDKKGLKFLYEGAVIGDKLAQGLQFGGLVGAVANPVGAATRFFEEDQPGGASVLEAGRQVGKYMEWEQEKIGKPIVQGLLTPFSPILPDAVERGIVGVGSAFFTPSSAAFFLIPIGRAATLGRVMGRIGGRAAVGEITGAQAATQARMSLRQMFSPSTRTAAQTMIARRTGAPMHEVIRETIENPAVAKKVFEYEEKFKSLRKATPRRWQSELGRLGADDMDFMERVLFSDLPPKATPAQAQAHFQNNAWWSNLMRGDAIDPRLLTDNVGLTARAWNSFKATPFLGTALEHATGVLQPIAMVSAPLRRLWLTAASHAPGWNWQAKSSRDTVVMMMESGFGTKAVQGELTGLKYVGPATRLQDPALKQVTGRLVDVLEHPKYYELTKHQKDVIKRAQRIFDLDRAESLSVGVSMGQVNGGYMPHRIAVEGLTPSDAQKLGEFFARQGTSPRFASLFRKRRYNWDEFVQRADELNQLAASEGFSIVGSGVETDLRVLADWRFGHAARKKVEQFFFHLLARDPDTAGLVFRPSRLGPSLREALTKEGFPFEEVAAGFKEVGKPQLAQAAGRRVQVGAHELALRPTTGLTDPKLAQMAKEANALMGGSIRRELGVETSVSKGLDYMRAILLSHDLSPIGLVQGMRVFAADPVAYFAQMGEAATWMMTKQGKRLWGLQNLPNVQFWTRRGLTLGNVLDIRPDMLEKLGPTIYGKKVKTPLAAAGFVNRQLMDVVQVAKLKIANTMLGAMSMAQREPQVASLIEGLPWFKKAKTKLGAQTWQDASFDDMAAAVSDGLNNAIGPINFTAVNQAGVASFGERFLILTPSWTRGNVGQIVTLDFPVRPDAEL
jgi:hypothetical protein